MHAWEWDIEDEIAREIVAAALAACERETALPVTPSAIMHIDTPTHTHVAQADTADLIVEIGGHRFRGEVKRWAAHRLRELVHASASDPERLLIVDYLNANAAQRLAAQGIQFIDTAGNAHLDRPGLKILIRGQPRPAALTRDGLNAPGDKAFQRKGLILIYHLLTRPELVTASLRTLAAESGVSHGTADNVIKALDSGGFIAQGRGGRRRLTDPRRLRDRWVTGYAETLAPKLELGAFYREATDWWGSAEVTDLSAAWGGEVAAARYTGYLQPELATLFVPRANLPALMQRYRLTQPPAGRPANLRLRERFWGDDAETDTTGLVHPLLAYADLLASQDARNADTARVLHDRYLVDTHQPA
ncbi:type IV toxin-antitoxin system AbiEi family antitoxin [Salinicola endophyticus]|nr:type IV toxin-antitoxin system AbiEi family antitoxin [Salinicola endophyticus]